MTVAREPEGPAVPLGNGKRTKNVRGAVAQHWDIEPLKRIALPTKTRLGLRACRMDLVFEGCVKRQGPDTRPRPQAGAVCVRGGNRKDEISLHTGGVRNQGTVFSRKGAGDGGWIPEAYLC